MSASPTSARGGVQGSTSPVTRPPGLVTTRSWCSGPGKSQGTENPPRPGLIQEQERMVPAWLQQGTSGPGAQAPPPALAPCGGPSRPPANHQRSPTPAEKRAFFFKMPRTWRLWPGSEPGGRGGLGRQLVLASFDGAASPETQGPGGRDGSRHEEYGHAPPGGEPSAACASEDANRLPLGFRGPQSLPCTRAGGRIRV